MAKRKFTSYLSRQGLDNLIKELETYRTQTLPSLTEQAISQLIDKGISVAETKKGNFTSFIAFKKTLNREQYGCTGIMLGYNTAPNVSVWYNTDGKQEVEISSILMAEFGSGVHAESTVNIEQKGHRGTFPNQTHAFQQQWSYATKLDENGNPTGWVTTSGIEPTAPMYWASVEMMNELESVVRSVFK